MMRVRLTGTLMVVVLAGCSSAPPPLEDSGSKKAVTDFFEAIVSQDWEKGLELVVPEKKSNLSLEQFKAQAIAYRKRLGFDPEQVFIRSSEEHGNEAIAHLSLTGHILGQRKSFRESVVVKRRGTTWFVVPPNHFGPSNR